MGVLDWFKPRKRERRGMVMLDDTLHALVYNTETITRTEALNIPSVAGCVNLIADTVATLPIKLYRETGGKTQVVEDDVRPRLLNDDTGDMLDGMQFKAAMVRDYLLDGAAYAYIRRRRNTVVSLHYLRNQDVSISVGADPIYKTAQILVGGTSYRDYDFIRVLRDTRNGVTGRGIIAEANDAIGVAYRLLQCEQVMARSGGSKKGFLQSTEALDEPSMDKLRQKWRQFRAGRDEVIVLNKGLTFADAGSTAVEMQLNEHKTTNAAEICKLFCVPPAIFGGAITDEVWRLFVTAAIRPILAAFETACNKNLLLENEKKEYYFAFDTKELLKGDIEKRFRAYEIAAKNGYMQIDEIRYLEDLPPLGLKFVRLGLQDVLYDPETNTIYTPNTDRLAAVGTQRGGDADESGDTIRQDNA